MTGVVIISIHDKCRSKSLLYGYPNDWCNTVTPRADLSVYDVSGRIWYEEFESLKDALDALRTAVREREVSGWICTEKRPAVFADEAMAYECIRGSTRHTLVVHKR